MKILICILWLLCCLSAAQANSVIDPTKPANKKLQLSDQTNDAGMAQSALKLTAIINQSEFKQAIINGQSLLEGQQIRGLKVILISQNHVILDGSEGKQTLYVNNNNVKKDAHDDF